MEDERHTLGAVRRLFRAVALLVCVIALLTGCGRSSPPAPVSYGGARSVSVERPDLYVVRKGDTAYGISRMFNVDLRALIDRNNLRPPYTLRVGQRLSIPSPPVHVVRRGDTVYGISRQYDVDMRELVRLNDIKAPYTIVVGQRIMLPGAAGPATRVAGAGKSPPAQAPRSSRSNSQDQTATQKQSAAAATAKKAAASPPRPAAIPNPKPRSSGRFLWPVKGRLISSFGTKSGGLHNDGINIAAPRGAPIVAAENGVVAYVGNELRGFGNLVLIKHADNYITAYAHADEILVSRGQQVTRGQTVARVGSSGSVSDPQLHFEVRRGTKAIDPASVLGTATAAIGDHSQGLGGA